jgi:N-acetylneuraminic acid mutarotase
MTLQRTFGFLTLAAFVLVACFPNAWAAPAENTWVSKAPMPTSDFGLRAATVEGKIYVMGGSINYEYNPASDSWVAKAAMPTPRNWFSIATYQNKIYTFGGRANGFTFNTTEVYNPKSDTWVTLTTMPLNASDIDANYVDGKIYLMGLPDSQSPLCINLAYDVIKDAWANKTNMPYPVSAYQSAVVDDKIYVFSGFDFILGHTRFYNQTQIYDPKTDSWTLGTSMSSPLLGAGTAATTGVMAPKMIYLIGGQNGIDGINTTLVYNPKNDSWATGSLMPTARTALTVAVVNDLIYAFGGQAYVVFNPPLTVNEEYTPFGYGTPELPTATPPAIGGAQMDLTFFGAVLIVVLIIAVVYAALIYKGRKR